MESILRIRGKDGNLVDIPALQGADGLSAYQIWLNAGNTGTEADFLESLKGGASRPTDEVIISEINLEYNNSLATIWDYSGIVTEEELSKEIIKIEYLEDGNWKDIGLLLQQVAATPIIRTNRTMFVCNEMGNVAIAVFYTFGDIPDWWANPTMLGELKVTYYKD